jgi:DNA-binding NarL/FixJ family response regulator
VKINNTFVVLKTLPIKLLNTHHLFMKYRIVIFDDNKSRRDSLKILISMIDDMECVGEFEDCRQVLDKISHSQPDLVLMDIDMPHVNGIEGVKLIRTKYPTLKIIMQTVFEDNDKVFSAICAGADGYILKQTAPNKLLDGMREAMEGGAPMSPVIAKKVLSLVKIQDKIFKKSDFELTKRELEILKYLAMGYSYKMIAEACFISYATVNTHISNIYTKLKVESVGGAVSIAINNGLIKME